MLLFYVNVVMVVDGFFFFFFGGRAEQNCTSTFEGFEHGSAKLYTPIFVSILHVVFFIGLHGNFKNYLPTATAQLKT